MSFLRKLNPHSVWLYFDEICKIPRLSKNEDKIRQYIIDFARKNSLEFKQDEVGNVLITKPATPGMENRITVVLQSHMDMVGEKKAGSLHNWETDPVIPVIEKEWITARETTLGADDGIGVASQLAILTDQDLKAGKIECLFTVDEESGMTGAINLKPDFFTGRTLLNLDSEDEGILYIGCAGGIETVGKLHYDPVPAGEKSGALEVTVSGLHGGHSGDEIHKGYGNSIKILNRILQNLSVNYNILISSFEGGNLRNAIPREASAKIAIDTADMENIKRTTEDFHSVLLKEFGDREKELSITVKVIEPVERVMDRKAQENFLKVLSCCPHGALAWSKDMDDLVETSTNLASVKFTGGNTITIVTTQRSSIEPEKHNAASMVVSCMELADAEIIQSGSYPGWKPDLTSQILDLTRKSYINLFGKEPLIKAIHAGLECGLIYEKFPGIDMISFGPTIRGAHTIEEKIEIRTVLMFWTLLRDVVSNMPVK
jgi:dipeptidase D